MVESTSLHCGMVYMHTANSGKCCLDIICIKNKCKPYTAALVGVVYNSEPIFEPVM